MRMQPMLVVFVLTASFFNTNAVAADLVLVDSSITPISIILPKDATLFNKLAARDLANYLGRMSGATFPIVDGDPTPRPQHAIWVGMQPALKELFPDASLEFKHPEEILLKADEKHLVIAGRDVWDPKVVTIRGGKTPAERQSHLAGFPFANRDVEGFQFEYGTVNAVYTFLQDKLGVRWLWPGVDGEVVPQHKRIALKPFEVRYHPRLRMRQGVFAPLAIYKQGGKPGTAGGDWVRRQRVQLDSLFVPAGGHGFADWLDRFKKSRPEYFALQSDGKRGWSGSSGTAKICESSEAVWNQWLADAEESIAKNPHRRIFNCAPNDSTRHGHCCCEACRSWDAFNAERRIWMYMSSPSLIGTALSDRQVKLANTLGRLLNERHPGEGYKVMIHAYGYSRPAPVREVPSDYVYVALAHGFLFERDRVDIDSPKQTKIIDQFNAWTAITPNTIWRPNIGDPACWQSGGPGDPMLAGEALKLAVDKGVRGIHVDMLQSWWATQGPLYYAMAQLAWNADQSVADVLEDYYRSGFGAAANDVQAYWMLMQTAWRNVALDEKKWLDVFTPEHFQRAGRLLDQAAANPGLTKAERTRLKFVHAGLDYLRLNTANQSLVRESLLTKTTSPTIKERTAANWAAMEQLARRYPEAFPAGQFETAAGELSYIHPETNHHAAEALRRRKAEISERLQKNAVAEEPDLRVR